MNSEEQEHVPFPFDDDTESMNSEEQEPVRFPFDDDTEDMNSDEEADQWTNLPPKCFQMQEQTSSIQKSQEK